MAEILSNVEITVETSVPEQPKNNDQGYIFVYTVTIANNSSQAIKLLDRYWLITDANGEEIKVEGEGVIGKQPDIAVNDSFTYSSYCVLKTPVGTMQGYYGFLAEQDKLVEKVAIPAFTLAMPNILH